MNLLRIIFVFLLCGVVYGQKKKSVFSTAEPIKVDTVTFGNIPDDVQVIGLGEFTHGGRECILYKAELCKYLIQHHSVRVILFEVTDIRLRPIDDYLSDDEQPFSKKEIELLIKNRFNNTIYLTEEYTAFFSWLKQYNLDAKNKITVRGIDIFDPIPSSYLINNFLFKIAPDFVTKNIDKWTSINNDSLIINDISNWFKENKEHIKTKTSTDDFQKLSMDVRNAKAFFEYASFRFKEKNQHKLDSHRDSLMAVNTYELTKDKCILWAHNGHVVPKTKTEALIDRKTYFPIYRKQLGVYLKSFFKNKYFVIATDYAKKARITVIDNDNFSVKSFFVRRIQLLF